MNMLIQRLNNRVLEPSTDGGAPASGGNDPAFDRAAEPDWGALSTEIDNDFSNAGEEPAAAAPAEPAQPKTETPPASATPPAAAPPAATPPAAAAPPVPTAPAQPQSPGTVQPQQPAQPAQPQAAAPAAPQPGEAAQPQEQPLTPANIEAAYAKYREQILPQLEKQYALSPEQAEALSENPGVEVPKLLAQMHYNVQVAAFTGIMSQLPTIVQSLLTQNNAIQEAEGKLYSRFPALRDPKHAKALDSVLKVYRTANPNATTQEMIEKGGMMAMLSLGLPLDTPQAPTPPAAPGMPGSPAAPPQAARPAGTGSAGGPRLNTQGGRSVWDEIAEEIVAESQ